MKHFKYFVTERMLEDCIELAKREDVVAQDSLPVGEIGFYQNVTFISNPLVYAPHRVVTGAADPRRWSKCKRCRREARGW
jgi:hypothetical protein